jgi:hypothetical protein
MLQISIYDCKYAHVAYDTLDANTEQRIHFKICHRSSIIRQTLGLNLRLISLRLSLSPTASRFLGPINQSINQTDFLLLRLIQAISR